MSDEIRNDPEARRILTEEEKTLTRVREALAALTKTHVRKDYDAELLELRDAVNEARMEDVPALLAEMERLREVANRRAEVTVGVVDPNNPYFGHMKLTEGGRVRDVLIGNSTYVDTDNGVRVVDWRDAPVSRVFYRYNEGDDYEEEFGSKLTEGTVTVRRAVVIRDGELKRVVCPQGTFYRNREGWQRGAASTAKLAGGQLSAVRPPTDEERRAAKALEGQARRRGRQQRRQAPPGDSRADRSAAVRAHHQDLVGARGDPGRRGLGQDHHRPAPHGVPRVQQPQALQPRQDAGGGLQPRPRELHRAGAAEPRGRGRAGDHLRRVDLQAPASGTCRARPSEYNEDTPSVVRG
jgi:hypothetical protein